MSLIRVISGHISVNYASNYPLSLYLSKVDPLWTGSLHDECSMRVRFSCLLRERVSR